MQHQAQSEEEALAGYPRDQIGVAWGERDSGPSRLSVERLAEGMTWRLQQTHIKTFGASMEGLRACIGTDANDTFVATQGKLSH